MRFLSLFSGIGGFEIGLERAGMECVGQVEIDPYCRAVLQKHWPHVKKMEDIREVKGTEFGAVDLVCGGFPCQPFSTAGKRRGKDDDRYLWPEMLRVIDTAKPTWVLGENVAGLIGMALDQVFSDLEGIGYKVQGFVIPACAVDAPHRRDRIWIVAYSEGQRDANRKERAGWTIFNQCGSDVSDTTSDRCERDRPDAETEKGLQQRPESTGELSGRPERLCEDVSDSESIRPQGEWSSRNKEPETHGKQRLSLCSSSYPREWPVESGICRVVNGLPNRAHRIKALGNAVVPQVVEEIGKAIMRTEKELKKCVDNPLS